MTLSYNNDSSWGLTYNMFGDKLLGLNLFPDSLYESQTAWYSTVMTPYGVPLDTRHTYTKSDWQMWTAAIMTNTTVRDGFISGLYNFAQDGASNQPFADWYETSNGTVDNIVSTGEIENFRARPVAGGHLALVSFSFFSVQGSCTYKWLEFSFCCDDLIFITCALTFR